MRNYLAAIRNHVHSRLQGSRLLHSLIALMPRDQKGFAVVIRELGVLRDFEIP